MVVPGVLDEEFDLEQMLRAEYFGSKNGTNRPL